MQTIVISVGGLCLCLNLLQLRHLRHLRHLRLHHNVFLTGLPVPPPSTHREKLSSKTHSTHKEGRSDFKKRRD